MYFYLLTLLQWHFISAALTETLLLQSRKGQQKQHCHKSTSGRATKLHSDLLPICRNSAYDSVAKMHPLLAGVLKKCCGGMSKLPNIQIAVVAKLDIMARWSRWQNPALTCYYVSMAAVLSFASAEVAGPGSEGSTCVGISLPRRHIHAIHSHALSATTAFAADRTTAIFHTSAYTPLACLQRLSQMAPRHGCAVVVLPPVRTISTRFLTALRQAGFSVSS